MGIHHCVSVIIVCKQFSNTNILSTWLYNFSFSATCGPLSWVIPAEIFDTRTRAKGVSLATMTSFAFNTMIGQVTGIAMAAVSWKYYLLFVICNFTNAAFFWAVLPETKKLPLEEMNYLFTHAPWFVPGTDKAAYQADFQGDLERRAREYGEKRDLAAGHEEDVDGGEVRREATTDATTEATTEPAKTTT